jgi:hypothetical protein
MKLPRLVKQLGSLRFSALLLLAAAVLVFFGTLDQVHLGIRGAQIVYFESLLAIWNYPEHWWGSGWLGWIHLPIPGGYLLGPLFLLNLTCSHFVYFRPDWKHLGIVFIHLGIAVLLLGQLVANLKQEDAFMWLDEGGTSNYLQSFSEDELVLIDITEPGVERTVSFPAAGLETGQPKRHPRLPFIVQVEEFHLNAHLLPNQEPTHAPGTPHVPRRPTGATGVTVTMGLGAGDRYRIEPKPPATEPNSRNLSTAIVRLLAPEGEIGAWLVCNAFEDQMPDQELTYRDRRYKVALRFKRTPLPYSLTLLTFVHERYPGTNIPKHFSSRVRLVNPGTGEDREVDIYMNHPLRYEGRTFYQASFGKSDTASMFQVVKNPGWLLPYVASTLMTVGMMLQFSVRLFKPRKKATS